MTDIEAFFCQNEIYDVKTIMSEQRLEGKFIFLVSTPFSLVMDEVKQREWKSCFILAENFNPSSLWVGSHRYTRIFRLSKPLWANNAHKVEPNTSSIKNLSKSVLILKSPKTNLKLPFLIAKSSPMFSFLQYCRAIGGCYWT